MENILSHLLRSGEPQGAGLGVAADRQSRGDLPLFTQPQERNFDPTRFCSTCRALGERTMSTVVRPFIFMSLSLCCRYSKIESTRAGGPDPEGGSMILLYPSLAFPS